MKRGDIVRIAEGKPRPAVVVQWDDLPTPTNVIVCPLTTFLVEAPTYRPSVGPDVGNGLSARSQLMVDRLGAVRRDRIDGVIGRLAEPDMLRLTVAITVVLDLAG